MNRIVLTFGLVFAAIASQSQQMQDFNSKFLNPYLINPAFAGYNETPNLTFFYRKNWAGFVNSPESQLISFDYKVKKAPIGLGFQVYNDAANVIKRTGGVATYSYNVRLGEESFARLGASLGIVNYGIKYSSIISNNPDESVLFNDNMNGTNFDGNIGVGVIHKNLVFGFAIEQFFQNRTIFTSQTQNNSLSLQKVRHYNAFASYQFNFVENKYKLVPTILVKGVQGTDLQYIGNISLIIKDFFTIAASYKHNVGFAISPALLINEKFKLGYSYEIPTAEIQAYSTGSHEFFVGYDFVSDNGNMFSNREYKQLNRKDIELAERVDYLIETNNELNERIANLEKSKIGEIKDLEELLKEIKHYEDELHELIKENEYIHAEVDAVANAQKTEQDEIEKLTDKLNNSNISVKDAAIENNDANQDANNTEGTTSVSNDIKTDKFYVVVGALRDLDHTEKYQAIMLRELNIKTEYIQNNTKTYYFVYSSIHDSYHDSKPELDKMQKLDDKGIIVREPWLYKSK